MSIYMIKKDKEILGFAMVKEHAESFAKKNNASVWRKVPSLNYEETNK